MSTNNMIFFAEKQVKYSFLVKKKHLIKSYVTVMLKYH